MRCLEKDRTRRYETANGLAADLKRHLSHEPVTARPPSQVYRLRKAYQRNRLAFSAAACVLASLILALAFIWSGALRERRARVNESIQRNLAERRRQEAEAQREAAEVSRTVAQTEQQRADAQARNAMESQQQSRRLLYAADMNLAQQSLKLNNLGRARRLLDRHRPQAGEEDLRGWEWRYLWQLARSTALVTLTNRTARGWSVSFSPDGTHLAVGWYGGRVDLWDAAGRRFVRALTDRESTHQGHVAFSTVSNVLAATSEPGVVALHDLDSGRESVLWRAPDPSTWCVRDLSFSQDGSRVVIYAGSLSELGDAVWVVNVSSGQMEGRHPTAHGGDQHHGAARLSPDNRRLYLPRSDASKHRYSIQCLDLASGQALWQTDWQRDDGLTALAISPDGRVLVSGSGYEDPTIRVWDTTTGRLLVPLNGHTAWVCKLAFSKDGRHLVSAASDQVLRFWATSTWTETKVLRGHTDEVHAVAISATARLVASASKDGTLRL